MSVMIYNIFLERKVLMKGNIILNIKEQRLNDIIIKFISKEINIKQVCRLTGLSERQIYRKKKAYKEKGVESVIHKLKLNPSKKGYDSKFKNKIINLYVEEYFGWNFHHFNDFLEDYHNIKVSDYFIYKLLTSNNIASPYKYKSYRKSHPPRPRRENAGELIQVDASKHQWLFGDDSYYYLHGGIDDATGIVTSCFLTKEETIFGYQMIMKDTILNYGIPECLYTDYRTIFKSTKKYLTLEEELHGKEIKNTRFSNMLKHIGTDIISTIDPRSKGRIERLWRTFQDRLYKELIKQNINTLEKANEYITNVFIPKHNSRFAFQFDYNKSVFVMVDKSFDFNKQLAVYSEHAVYHNCYLRYNNHYHVILKDNEKAYLPTKGKVKVYTFLDGSEHVLFNDSWYDLKSIKNFSIKPIEYIHSCKSNTEINLSKAHKPSYNHPWKNAKPITDSLRIRIGMYN